MAITVIACWARFLEGVAEDGSPIEIVDDRIPDLRARAARHDDNILAVVGGNPLFHGLEGRSEFARPLRPHAQPYPHSRRRRRPGSDAFSSSCPTSPPDRAAA